MQRKLVSILLLVVFSGALSAQKTRVSQPLVVVLDPGHGGKDPGSSATFNGARVAESEYVYDVALRVERLLTRRGVAVSKTVSDGVNINDKPAFDIMPIEHTARFVVDGSTVGAGSSGLSKRIAHGNRVLA